ncbi:hypothetical protein M433DRAFT_474544 [Acidomyces richmondensis BFW]|nr:MAG: hypothetical protein FE78DRAFT_274029 [Acidomyces sp. 'richmondensis']KYG47765.1 hypothetical protein M433DRAFT_474544 [Acidomyces richmondensis BFW]
MNTGRADHEIRGYIQRDHVGRMRNDMMSRTICEGIPSSGQQCTDRINPLIQTSIPSHDGLHGQRISEPINFGMRTSRRIRVSSTQIIPNANGMVLRGVIFHCSIQSVCPRITRRIGTAMPRGFWPFPRFFFFFFYLLPFSFFSLSPLFFHFPPCFSLFVSLSSKI